MRERRRGLTWLMTVVVVVVVVVAPFSEITAIPTTAVTNQPAVSTVGANHVEDQYLDDALGDWLDNFGTYTFMVKQDLDTHEGDADEQDQGGQEVGVDAEVEEAIAVLEERREEDEEEEDVEEEWSAPIAVSIGSKSLLDPHHDYLVTVESLVAEEGSIFLTLSKYDNQTTCGVGGLTQEEEMRQAPRRATGGGFDVAQGGSRGGSNHRTTFIAFGLQQEGNTTSPDTSKWIAVSQQYWWASGQLEGGGMLSILFTPPECGCLALSAYFALPVGNLTLVVGPQAYPDELQILLCVDPLPSAPDHEYDEEENYLQQPSALVASRNLGEDETETEAEGSSQVSTVAPRKRKMSKEEKKAAKKTRRQMKRQRIRQAGRRQARKQGPPGGRRAGRRWNRKKNQRKRTKVWKKLHKRGRKGRRRGGKHHHNHHHDGVNGTASENMTHHHHNHHHHAPGLNSTANQEERLVDILLRDLPLGNSTETEDESDATEGEEDDVAVTNDDVAGEGEGEDHQTPRQRRKNRRQRKKMLRKQRKKTYPSGVKFCCKQGVKHKKNILEFDSTSGNSPGTCNMSTTVVSTFASHQFGIEEDTCTTTFTTCCERFTEEMWEGIKAKKEARKTERKQRRKSRRQGRKQRRREERRLRKEMRRQSHAQEEVAK